MRKWRRGSERALIKICFKDNIKGINLYKTVKLNANYLTLTTWAILNLKVKHLTTNTLKLSHSKAAKWSYSTLEVDDWDLLNVFGNNVRVEIVKLLLKFEWRSLSEIAEKLENSGWKMTLPGVLKHMKELEKAGIVRRESGIFAEKPDARKTIYMLEGRERVEKIMQRLQENVMDPLQAGVIFSKTAELARKVQGMGPRMIREERRRLEHLLAQCESERVHLYLTEDEEKKVKLWRKMMEIL